MFLSVFCKFPYTSAERGFIDLLVVNGSFSYALRPIMDKVRTAAMESVQRRLTLLFSCLRRKLAAILRIVIVAQSKI